MNITNTDNKEDTINSNDKSNNKHINSDTIATTENEQHNTNRKGNGKRAIKKTESHDSLSSEDNSPSDTSQEPIQESKSKSKSKSKTVFEGNCNNCSKSFKKQETYDKHKIEQTCYKLNEITYCKICFITYQTHTQYKTHLISMEHINNIGCDSLEKLKKDVIPLIHSADPYLNTNDINKISKTNLGDSFTFVFEKGDTQTITLGNNNLANNLANNIANNLTTTNTTTKENKLLIQNQIPIPSSIHNPIPVSIPVSIPIISQPIINIPTQRQVKIITFLENQTSIPESGKSFYKMLDNKLKIEDYKGLQCIIKNINISNEFKDNYNKTIDLFTSFLVKQKTKGEKMYKDKDISQLVINLTS